MRRRLLWNSIFAVLFVFMLAAETFAVLKLISLDMLPQTYLLILIGVLVLLSVGLGFLLFIQSLRPVTARQIVAMILAIILTCGCAAIATVANDVLKTIQSITVDLLEIPTRGIYVLADNQAEDVEDTVGYTYGYLKDYDESCTQQVFEKIYQKTGIQPTTAGYKNIATMVWALLENRIDAIVLNSGVVGILEETEEFMYFSLDTRMMAQIRVEGELFPDDVLFSAEAEVSQQEQTEETEPEDMTEPTEEPVDYSELKPFVIYVSGSDSHDTEIVTYSRSDVNILAVVNPLTKQVLLINTPRDYYVDTTAKRGEKDKLTHCGIYGTKCSMRTLGNLYGVEIEHFVRINFTGFKKLIDAIGGVTVYSDYPFLAITRTQIVEGENHLNGQQALDFARERVTVPGGDNDRGRHQMQVITAVIEKATTGTTIISNYSDIMASVEGMFSMNVPQELISAVMKMQLSDMARWNVVSFSATGSYANEECYSAPGLKLSVVKPYYSSVNKAARLIDMVFAGEILTEEVINSIG